MKIDSESTVMIGDDLRADICGAKNIGLKAILKKRPFDFPISKNLEFDVIPDAEIEKLTELLSIIKDL